MPITYDEYKNNPLIVFSFSENDKYGFKFGVGKASRLLANKDVLIEVLEDFVEKNKRPAQVEDKQ